MSTALDLLLILALLASIWEGFQQGPRRMIIRLAGTLLGMIGAAVLVRGALIAGFIEPEGWGFFLVYMITFAVVSGLVEGLAALIFRRQAPPDEDKPKRKRAEDDPARELDLAPRIAGGLLGGVQTAFSNGIVILALSVLTVPWIEQAISGSTMARHFIAVVRNISFLLPPELRLW